MSDPDVTLSGDHMLGEVNFMNQTMDFVKFPNSSHFSLEISSSKSHHHWTTIHHGW